MININSKFQIFKFLENQTMVTGILGSGFDEAYSSFQKQVVSTL